ncbi:MAG: ABC transporter ATP-binding protein, partial [Bacteroidales bacterium]
SFDYALIDKALADTGILDKKDQYIAELSDGERQKAMIAKALTQESPIIILDEPTSFLDIISRIEIMNLLRDLAHKQNKAILLSTHDLEQALLSSDKLWLLSKKGGLTCGSPEDLIFNNSINHLFDHRSIQLDKLSGSFRRKSTDKQKFKIIANPEYTFWIRNLLNRFDYGIASGSESFLAQIEIKAPSDIKLITNVNDLYQFGSFEALSNWLRTSPDY